MRDVSAKIHTLRTATARAVLKASPSSIRAILDGTVPKGDPRPVARIAAMQAVKDTPRLVPYCHTVPIDWVGVEFAMTDTEITADVSVTTVYKTGVEIEAMAGAMVAALNLYDVLKMIDDEMEVVSVVLLDKKGGKSGFQPEPGWKAGVLVVSDRVSGGSMEDRSGATLRDKLTEAGGDVVEFGVVPDEPGLVRSTVERWCQTGLDVVFTSGGTGVGPRDTTPEAVDGLFDRRLPGVEEALRSYSQARMPFAMLSRSCAGVVGRTVVVCVPGSVNAARDAVDALFPYLLHAAGILAGEGH
ncbi:MAG: bifunctional molybdenum cofactor biosynthesis protein MoaC/MoaB [Armatimonadetes bacterium]|nr:bifunctional molybdenum cofactor biosynthesis protein MoaC/MoaB [Armatimonadota bacterium]